MKPLPVYDVWAVISPDGVAERVNTLTHKTFRTISETFPDHGRERFIIWNVHGSKVIHVVDLWQTKMADNFPYVTPFVIPDLEFDTVDHAIGYVALHLC